MEWEENQSSRETKRKWFTAIVFSTKEEWEVDSIGTSIKLLLMPSYYIA